MAEYTRKYKKKRKEGQEFWHDDHPWSKAIKRDVIVARLKYLEGYKEKLQLNFDNYEHTY